jgi:hypothetical protein
MLVSQDYKKQLLSAGDGGATRQALSKAQLQDFSIECPESLSEQQRIVGILDEAFEGVHGPIDNGELIVDNEAQESGWLGVRPRVARNLLKKRICLTLVNSEA